MLQDVAAEMNLAETAFLIDKGDCFDLRWFTPTVEVDLCGHATLASAHILWQQGLLDRKRQARFQTRSGLLTADLRDGEIELNFPSTPPEPMDKPPNLDEHVGAELLYFGKSKFDYFAEVESESVLRELDPALSEIKKLEARGFILTCRSSSREFDFVSRFFAPAVGIDEDPVTGSAHCALGPFWARRLERTDMRAYQASSRAELLE